jgi:hypothetical protein
MRVRAGYLAVFGFMFVVMSMLTMALSSRSRPEVVLCMDEEAREQVRSIMAAGIDQALKNQTTRLFESWMKDAHEQPKRARVGMNNAVKAYIDSRAEILSNWNPPRCGDRRPP